MARWKAKIRSAYHAPAVHFNQATDIRIASLVSPNDNRYGATSFWFKLTAAVFTPPSVRYGGLFIVEPGDIIGSDAYYDPNRPLVPLDRVSHGIWVGGPTSNDYIYLQTYEANPLITSEMDQWHHMLIASDLVAREVIVYLDDELHDVGADPATVVNGNPTVFKLNGLELAIADDGFGNLLLGDMADFWLMPGINLMSGGAIPEATRRKFISAAGKPVHLGEDGMRPTGTAPVVFMSGNASQFATNRGTGGAFTTSGTLTNAATSPSD